MIKNHKDADAEIRHFEPYVWGTWEMVTSSHEYAKLASNQIEYTIIVPADSAMKVEFEYRIDRRTEVVIKK